MAVAARMSLVTFLGIYFVTRLRIDLSAVGVAFLCESMMRGLAAPAFGALSDRIGRRVLLISAAIGTALMLPCFLLVQGPASLLLWSLAMGLTGAANMPVATALLIDLAPPERRQSVLALNYTTMSVAYTIAVMPAGYVAQRGYGLLAAISCAGYVLVALLYGFFLQQTSAPEKERSGLLRDTLFVFRDRSFLLFACLGFVFPLSMGLVVTVSPIFGADLGLGEGYIGLVLGGNSIIVAALALPVAARMERGGPFGPLPAAAILVALALAAYGAIPHAGAALLVGTVVFSFGELIFSSAVPASVARLAPPERRGAYQGGWALVASFSMGSALVLSGFLQEHIGWQGGWIACAALLMAAAAALAAARRRLSERAQH
ncbi:MAG: MFS transporter [Betaproteobacteria bacterium]